MRFFDDNRGFGVVVDDAGREAFLGTDVLRRDGIPAPSKGQRIRCYIAEGVKGPVVSEVDRRGTARLASSVPEPSMR